MKQQEILDPTAAKNGRTHALPAQDPERTTLRPTLVPFASCDDPGWAEAMTIYRSAFPAKERWHEERYAEALADPLFEADAIRIGDRMAGLLFHWQAGPFRYVEHLAVDPALRGQQVGSRALEALGERFDRLVLEIDPPEDEISVRRLHFYERSGFVANPWHYLHPSFRRPFEPHRLVLLSRPAPLGNDEARAFADFIREHVLRYSDHEHPELPRIEMPAH